MESHINQNQNQNQNHLWFVAQNLEEAAEEEHQIFDPLCHYRRGIPELQGKWVRECFHGWVVFRDYRHKDDWSLWNPMTSKIIHLPRLILEDGEYDDISDCCLTSPPDVPGSILLLTRYKKPMFVFCRLDCNRKEWIERSYLKQLRNVTRNGHSLLRKPSCCNGKIYAWTPGLLDKYSARLIQVDIVFVLNIGEKVDIVINLLPVVSLPHHDCPIVKDVFLVGSCSDLFTVFITLSNGKPIHVTLYKLNMTTMEWTEIKDLKNAVFFLDHMSYDSAYCILPVDSKSKLGGHIHILHKTGKVIYSYNVKDKVITMSSLHFLDLPPRSKDVETTNIWIWSISDLRLQGEPKCKVNNNSIKCNIATTSITFKSKMNKQNNELNIPSHLLEKIMEFCIGVEYLNFRATSKQCHLAAPKIQWNNNKRLQSYSLVSSPWLMVFEKDLGIITFIDPMFGDNYFIKPPLQLNLFYDGRIFCSRFGWLLLFVGPLRMVFYNPFTSKVHKIPVQVLNYQEFCFSAPPTSLDCKVVGVSSYKQSSRLRVLVFIYIARDRSRHSLRLYIDCEDPYSFSFPTFYGRDVYALFKAGRLEVLKVTDDGLVSRETVVDASPKSCSAEYFTVKCDQHMLLVIVEEFGESVEVFKLNDSTKEWEKINSLGGRMIFISSRTCFCMDAKTPEMENKIYFPLLHKENMKMVFYSLDTCRYHTFNGRNMEENFKGLYTTIQITKPHVWIEPSWS